MKYNELIEPRLEKLLVRTEQACLMVESTKVFEDMESAGWIGPVVDLHKCKLYRVDHIKTCVDRLEVEGYPKPKIKK